MEPYQILHSKRANAYYLEKCRVMVKNGSVVFLSENEYWNIPVNNTTIIMLGIGTSITQSAVKMLSAAGVLISFNGHDGTPLHSGTESAYFCPNTKDRPTKYCQDWCRIWFEEDLKFKAAKTIQTLRIKFIEQVWSKNKELENESIFYEDINSIVDKFTVKINKASSICELTGYEANFAKQLYKYISTVKDVEFTRDHDASDVFNRNLNIGNSFVYGLSATTIWVLGIPQSFALIHGKTRKSGLVYDIADIVKDAVILPYSFCHESLDEFRDMCFQNFIKYKVMDYMFDAVKKICEEAKE